MKVIKRDGKIEAFNAEKITTAVAKALKEVGEEEKGDFLKSLSSRIEKAFQNSQTEEVDVEVIQDMVEVYLMMDYPAAAKAYILYRHQRKEDWHKGWELTELQEDIFNSKYRYKNETFLEFLRRVGGPDRKVQKLIRDKKLIPGGRIMAGRGLAADGYKISLSNCYTIKSPEDNLESIFETAKKMARTYSYGGGCGVDLSTLRPEGSNVHNAARTTSGAVSFMDLYSTVTGLIGMNNRRGALMCSMNIDHPDIEKFIEVKNDLSKVTFANISVKVDQDFLRKAKEGKPYTLKFFVSDTGETISKEVNAKNLLMQIAKSAHKMAEPGMLYWDRVNSWHLMSEVDGYEFETTNPCGEQPLIPEAACSLAALNLSQFIKNPFTPEAYFDKESFEDAVRTGVRYMNEILDEGIPQHPLPRQSEMARDYRLIGLGTLGLADAMIKMGIRYGSEESLKFIDDIYSFKINVALDESAEMAGEVGPAPKYTPKIFDSPFFKENVWPETEKKIRQYGLRNLSLTTIAPTGTGSTLVGASGGAEPLFMVSYLRRTLSINDGNETEYKVYSPVIKELMEAQGLTPQDKLPDYVVTSHDIPWRERVDVQARLQKYIDSAISSTVNLPEETSVEDIFNLYLYAGEKGVKGITIYRDNCARSGILKKEEKKEEKNLKKENEKEVCPTCGGKLVHSGGCNECLDCGYSACSI